MSSSRYSSGSRDFCAWARRGDQPVRGARWNGINIAAMVLGFVLFWPVGLGILFWILSGRDVRDLPGAIREQWGRVVQGRRQFTGDTDNVVFNDYQQTQYDRIREIREEIASRAQRFREYRMDARRRADQEEFDRFMASGGKAGTAEQ